MGNIIKKNKKIKMFTDYKNIIELYNNIQKSGVYLDCDFMFFIDVTKSNLFFDGSTRHNIVANNAYSKYIIVNPYLTMFDIIKEFPFHDNTNFYLYFFGSYKADNSPNKLEKINIKQNNATNELYKKKINIYETIDNLINAYCNGIKIILNKEYHEIWGNNYFYKGVPIENIINEVINIVKITNKFTVAIIMLDGIDNNTNIYSIMNKLIEASNYPIEFICICIGNDNFDLLDAIDDFNYKKINMSYNQFNELNKKRKFDNFQNIILNKIVKRNLINTNIRNEIYKNIFMELPQVYEYIKRKDIINYKSGKSVKYNSVNYNNLDTLKKLNNIIELKLL